MYPRFLPLALLAACASKGGQGAGGQGDAAEVVVPAAPAGDAWRTARGVPWKEMLGDLAEADAVFVSGSREVELAVLDYLFKRGRLHAIALDSFPRTAQAALDDYSFGRIDEAELARRCGDFADGTPPLLLFARERRLPVLALGVERGILEAVERGGLEALSEEQRRSLPAVHATDAKTELFPQTQHGPVAIGLLLDVAADVIVRWYRDAAPEGAQVAVLAWSDPPRSLPDRLFARSGKAYRTLVALPGKPGDAEAKVFSKGFADYVWFLAAD
ncbi:MAG: ChaN family lipoprotein [Planctomycetes bacterium]|nr:ChaN family lipoprotein [Planctomycetota bacterium]